MNLAGLELHELRGDRKGTWAVNVTGNWRNTLNRAGKDADRVDSRTITEHSEMVNPPHPGEVLKELCLKPLNLSVTETADAMGVSRKTLSAILNGRAGISPEMAVRLSVAFHTSAESWLSQQLQFDLWHAEKNGKRLRVTRLTAA